MSRKDFEEQNKKNGDREVYVVTKKFIEGRISVAT